jgi:hypothetical protein
VTKRKASPLSCAHTSRGRTRHYKFAAGLLPGQLKHRRMNFSVVIDGLAPDISQHGAADSFLMIRQKLVSWVMSSFKSIEYMA